MSQIISYSDENEKVLFSRIERFFSDFDLSKLLLKCNFYKASGFSCVLILKQLFSLIFSGKNLYRALDLNSDDLSFRKNTAYRFLNEGRFNWERLLTLMMTRLFAFCAGQWPPVRLPVATRRYKWPVVNRPLSVQS